MERKKRGQGLVEFALILPVLLLILLGIIESALVIQGHLAVQHAAREAARFASTYQPDQGACMDRDKDGQIEGIGSSDPDDQGQPYPYCPPNGAANPQETDADYRARRVALIKRVARERAAGLRINMNYLGDTPQKFGQYKDQPGFFGVMVWGYPSFETNCNVNPDLCLDHPGIQGLPVRVLVRHNVEVLDPLYRVIAQYVTVQAEAQMINEGVQVGYGNKAPPAFEFNPNPDIGTAVVPTSGSGTAIVPTQPPTLPPMQQISITLKASPEGLDQVTNEMPDDRCHDFVATVTYQGQKVQYAPVGFSTTGGGFDFSGVAPYTEVRTNAQGQAQVTICGNEPLTATLRAWVDQDGNQQWNGEPSATAEKIWRVQPGQPYITVSDHDVVALDTVFAKVMDHVPGGEYVLYWCVISGTNTGTSLMPVTVDDGGDATGLEFTVPDESDGLYQLETHPKDGGGCGAGDLVAYSAQIHAIPALPELTIASLTLPPIICPRTTFTVSAVVQNQSKGSTTQIFDVDFNAYTGTVSSPPESPIGLVKQWVAGIDREGSVTVNALMWVDSPGVHTLWARADTSNYVEEWNESNNAYGISFTTGYTAPITADTGWRSPTSNYVGATGFDNPTGAYADDDSSYAYRNNNANNVSHIYGGYGFSFPAGITITGIEVGVDWWLDSTKGWNWINVSLSWDGGINWTDASSANTERTDDGSGLTNKVGGSRNLWGRSSNEWKSAFANDTFRVRLTLRTTKSDRDFRIDWVPVRVYLILPTCAMGNDPPPWGGDVGKAPGLRECQVSPPVLYYGDFEGNPDRVFSYWRAGGPNAYSRQSAYFYDGTLSMRLHTSLGSYPDCPLIPNPYLYQTVRIPNEVYTMTTMVVRGQRLVAESDFSCCTPATDISDTLYLKMRDNNHADLGPGIKIADGGVLTRTWAPFTIDVTGVVSPYLRAGQKVDVYFYGIQGDSDYDCTFFYLDALACDICTQWPIPPDEPGTASFGGLVRVLVQGIPRTYQGINVWAYSQGGEVLRTYTIQDGTYHFYNVPPGTYTIYAEYWESGILHYTIQTVTVAADERNYGVNLQMS